VTGGGSKSSEVLRAQYLGDSSIMCPVPRGSGPGLYRGAVPLETTVQASNDGVNWSKDKIVFSYYDGDCTIFDGKKAGGKAFTANPETCQVDIEKDGATTKQCFRPQAVDPRISKGMSEPNPCKRCVPKKDNTDFTFQFDSDSCGPVFTDKTYDHAIVGSAKAGPLVMGEKSSGVKVYFKVDAYANGNLEEAEQFNVRYAIQTPPGGNDEQIANFFDVDAKTGVVKLLKDVDMSALCNDMAHCAADPTKFNGFFQVRACDDFSNCASTSVFVQLVDKTNTQFSGYQFFSAELYTLTVVEKTDDGKQLTSSPPVDINAEDKKKNKLNEYGIVMGALNLPSDAFTLGKQDGKFTINPGKIDYELVDTLRCDLYENDAECGTAGCIWGLRKDTGINACIMKPRRTKITCTDISGQTWESKVDITVLNTDEAPSAVELSNNKINEGAPVGTVIGQLSCKDPEAVRQGHPKYTEAAGRCTYELAAGDNTDFAILTNATGSYLESKVEYDFEALPAGTGHREVKVFAKDAQGLKMAAPEVLKIDIADVNEAPVDLRFDVMNPSTKTYITRVGDEKFSISEDAPAGSNVARLSATDPDAASNRDPTCQIMSEGVWLNDDVVAEKGHVFVVRGNILQLKSGTTISFEDARMMKSPPTVTIQCVDNPVPPMKQKMSKPLTITLDVLDTNEAPSSLSFVQAQEKPTERDDLAAGMVLGTLTAIDEDADATAFSMAPRDETLYSVSAPECKQNAAGMQCTAELTLLRSISAAEKTCKAPQRKQELDENEKPIAGSFYITDVLCEAEIILTDGTDASASHLESAEIAVIDQWDPPTGVTIDVDDIAPGVQDNEKVGTVTVDDLDGRHGSFGARGFVVAMGSNPDVLGLKAAGGSRSRRADGSGSGMHEWDLIVKPGGAARIAGLAKVDLTFTVKDEFEICCKSQTCSEDLLKSCPVGVDFKDSHSYRKVLSVDSTASTNGGRVQKLGDVLLQATAEDTFAQVSRENTKYVNDEVRIPFRFKAVSVLDTVFKVSIFDAQDKLATRSQIVSVGAVKLMNCTGAAGEARVGVEAGGAQGYVGGGETELCEASSRAAVGFVGTHNKQDSAVLNKLELQPAANQFGSVDATYHRAASDVFFKVEYKVADSDDATQTVYWRLNVVYEDACETSAFRCGAGNTCSVCLVSGYGGTPASSATMCTVKADTSNGYKCAKGAPGPSQSQTVDRAMEKAKLALDQADRKVAAAKAAVEAACSGSTAALCAEAKKNLETAQKDRDAKARTLESAQGREEAEASKGDSDDGGSTGMIIGIVVALVICFVIAVVIVLVLMAKNQQQKREAAQAQFDHYSSIENTLFNGANQDKFEPGVTNPLYDWYHPKMSAAVARKFLESKNEGQFIVRDAEHTPGWHKLCVKTGKSVTQDNVKQTHSGQYELVAGDAQQPKFKTLPELIDNYCKPAPGAPYLLSTGNNAPASADVYGADAPYDMSDAAPPLPTKGADSLANPMYGADLSTGNQGTYADVDQPVGGYLDVGQRERQGSVSNGTYGTKHDSANFEA